MMLCKDVSRARLWLLVPVVFAMACSKEQAPRTVKGAQAGSTNTVASTHGGEKTLAEMATNDVVVSVNGVTLTRQQYEANVLRIIQRLSQSPNMARGQVAAMTRTTVQTYIPRFVKAQLMIQEARRIGVVPNEELAKAAEASLVAKAKKAGQTLEQYLQTAAVGPESARREAEEAILIDALIKTNVLPRVNISSGFVAAAVATIRAENQAILATNMLKLATLKELRKQAMAGEDFGRLANHHSDYGFTVATTNGYWGKFERAEITDRAVRTAVFALKPGEVSEVLEDEEGFQIVKLLEHHEPVKDAQGHVIDLEAVSLARIFLMRESGVEELPESEIKQQLSERMRERMLEEYINELMAKADIVYPHGTNFWQKATGSQIKPPAQPLAHP